MENEFETAIVTIKDVKGNLKSLTDKLNKKDVFIDYIKIIGIEYFVNSGETKIKKNIDLKPSEISVNCKENIASFDYKFVTGIFSSRVLKGKMFLGTVIDTGRKSRNYKYEFDFSQSTLKIVSITFKFTIYHRFPIKMNRQLGEVYDYVKESNKYESVNRYGACSNLCSSSCSTSCSGNCNSICTSSSCTGACSFDTCAQNCQTHGCQGECDEWCGFGCINGCESGCNKTCSSSSWIDNIH